MTPSPSHGSLFTPFFALEPFCCVVDSEDACCTEQEGGRWGTIKLDFSGVLQCVGNTDVASPIGGVPRLRRWPSLRGCDGLRGAGDHSLGVGMGGKLPWQQDACVQRRVQ